MRRLTAAVVAGLLAFALVGCGPYAPRDFPIVGDVYDVVGTWVHVDEGGDEVTFEARLDGTVSYENVPVELGSLGTGRECYDALDASVDRRSGEGSWEEWVSGQYSFDFGEIGNLAVPGGFLDFSRLHFFCADPDLGPTYSFERVQ